MKLFVPVCSGRVRRVSAAGESQQLLQPVDLHGVQRQPRASDPAVLSSSPPPPTGTEAHQRPAGVSRETALEVEQFVGGEAPESAAVDRRGHGQHSGEGEQEQPVVDVDEIDGDATA